MLTNIGLNLSCLPVALYKIQSTMQTSRKTIYVLTLLSPFAIMPLNCYDYCLFYFNLLSHGLIKWTTEEVEGTCSVIDYRIITEPAGVVFFLFDWLKRSQLPVFDECVYVLHICSFNSVLDHFKLIHCQNKEL